MCNSHKLFDITHIKFSLRLTYTHNRLKYINDKYILHKKLTYAPPDALPIQCIIVFHAANSPFHTIFHVFLFHSVSVPVGLGHCQPSCT